MKITVWQFMTMLLNFVHFICNYNNTVGSTSNKITAILRTLSSNFNSSIGDEPNNQSEFTLFTAVPWYTALQPASLSRYLAFSWNCEIILKLYYQQILQKLKFVLSLQCHFSGVVHLLKEKTESSYKLQSKHTCYTKLRFLKSPVRYWC